MPLADMLETRHTMSQTVRAEVSDKSHEWGYQLGSVYIRKVHFRDVGMIRQIEEKVVNRLRQVTSAIRQDGANQVSIITSTAERTGGGRVRQGGGHAAADRRRRRSTGSAKTPRSRRRSSRCSRIRSCSTARPASRSSRAAATCSPRCSRCRPRAGGAILQPPRARRGSGSWTGRGSRITVKRDADYADYG